MRRIMHVDMDAFFASIEQLRRPELRHRPVIVGGAGDPQARGVVSAASYEARQSGIRSGMPLRTAYGRCPEAVFLPVDFAHYRTVSARVKKILRSFASAIEDAGLDEAFLEFGESAGDLRAVALSIKRRIKNEIGLTCSVGIAHNKLLAKLASAMDKPDGLVVLNAGDIRARVWPLPVRRLWGVGPKTEGRLAGLGVETVGELARLSETTLVDQFGEAHGRYLHRAAWGMDDSPVITHWEPKSIGHEMTFETDVDDWDDIEEALGELQQVAVTRLRRRGYRARRVTVKLRYADFETHTHGLTLAAPSDEAAMLADVARQCLHSFPLDKKVRLVGVRLEGLVKAARAPAAPATEG